MRKICIYDDLGSTAFSVQQLKKCMETIYSFSYKIELINANQIRSGSLRERVENGDEMKVFLLCIGGGYDLGYLKALEETGCDEIRNYVLAGGNYLGICAGGYFAAQSIEFDLHGKYEVVGNRLGLFPGKAIGPVNADFQYNSEDGAKAIRCQFPSFARITSPLDSTDLVISLYLNGGFWLVPPANEERATSSYEPIAYYCEEESNHEMMTRMESKQPIAMVKCSYGKGKCLLSGVHIEFNANDLDSSNENIELNVKHKILENNRLILADHHLNDAKFEMHSNYLFLNLLLNEIFV